jgi:c-di-GMP-related signal transduction protein
VNLKTNKLLLARQAIFNKKGEVCAYELLYRSGEYLTAQINALDPLHGDTATSFVIAQFFTNMDINDLIGEKTAYINFTYNHIIQQLPSLLPKNRIVIEVLETVVMDTLLLQCLSKLRDEGYIIALDDFIYQEELIPLMNLAHIIKVDVLHLSKTQIEEQLIPLRTHFKGKLLAEKIENNDQLNTCMELGFDYFQGFFLNKPDALTGQTITENKTQLLRLLNELNNSNLSIKKIEEIILQTPKLSYRILRLTNSASFYPGKKIDSLMDAIILLGLVQIRHWITLLLLTSEDDTSSDLLERTLIRAKMGELVAKSTGYENPHHAYTVGILSTIDIILQEPMFSLLAKIHLNESLKEALLHRAGDLGRILKATVDYEEGNFNQLKNTGIEFNILLDCYLRSIAHANTVLHIINTGSD